MTFKLKYFVQFNSRTPICTFFDFLNPLTSEDFTSADMQKHFFELEPS